MAKKQQIAPKGFEEAVAELEKIIADLEGGQVALEESLVRFDRGTFLIQYCRGVLTAAEKQVELLSKGPDGSVQSEPLDEPA